MPPRYARSPAIPYNEALLKGIYGGFVTSFICKGLGLNLTTLSSKPRVSEFGCSAQETTLNYGGAQYIPTGRGLATQREPFVKKLGLFAVAF